MKPEKRNNLSDKPGKNSKKDCKLKETVKKHKNDQNPAGEMHHRVQLALNDAKMRKKH